MSAIDDKLRADAELIAAVQGNAGVCPAREDKTHCEHWWDGDLPCCDCHYTNTEDTVDGLCDALKLSNALVGEQQRGVVEIANAVELLLGSRQLPAKLRPGMMGLHDALTNLTEAALARAKEKVRT